MPKEFATAPELLRHSVYPWPMKLLRFSRGLFSAAIRAHIRTLLFQWLSLTWELSSGVRLRVANYGDWIIYNEIFVSGEYDRALALALDSATDNNSPFHIVDLGANVGFFTLRAVDRLRRRRAGDQEFLITAVEANGRCVEEFRARVFEENGLSHNVRVVHGLVGERRGVATLHRLDSARSHDTLFNGKEHPGAQVPYTDLSSLFASSPQIDLLKCDIEGAELLFIQNYPDVFQKVRVAVFEFHRHVCDTQRCQSLLREYGFTQHATFRHGDPCFIHCVWR